MLRDDLNWYNTPHTLTCWEPNTSTVKFASVFLCAKILNEKKFSFGECAKCQQLLTSINYRYIKTALNRIKTFFSEFEVTFYFLKHGGFKASKVFSHLLLEKNRHHKNKGSFHSVWREVFPPLKGSFSSIGREVIPPLKGGLSLRFGGRHFPQLGGWHFLYWGENSLHEHVVQFTAIRTVYGSSLVLRVLEELKGKSDKVVLVVMLEMLLLMSLANALRSDL